MIAITASVALGLAGCGGGETTAASPDPATAAATTTDTSATSGAGLQVGDPWVKASDPKMPGMTGLFATLKNPTDKAVTITAGSSPQAGMVELHETVMVGGAGTMRPKQGGFSVPAGGELVLKPGGNHVMLMGLKNDLKNGDTVKVTLTTSAGDLLIEAPVRAFAGGNESYESGSATGHSSHDGSMSSTATP